MQKYKLFVPAPPIWVAQYIYYIDIQRIIKCESKSCQSQETGEVDGFFGQKKSPKLFGGGLFALIQICIN